MGNILNMALPRLIEQGKGDPGDITDALVKMGYSRSMTVADWVKATADAWSACRTTGVPEGMEPTTPADVMAYLINEVVDEALNTAGATSASVAAALMDAGFRSGANHA